jgi:hypothetical protein
MIPVADVEPYVPLPLPSCRMPTSEDITEEGFGYFRGTWFLGRVPVAEAEATIRDEAEIIDWLDDVAASSADFEQLASAIESQDPELISEPLRAAAFERGVGRFLGQEDDVSPLDCLEIGVAGLTHALSTVRCLTAASCRWHMTDHSWSDCPVVLFAARAWRAEILSDLVSEERCGIGSDRDMLTIYGASVRDTHRLADRIVAERRRFRRIPDAWRPPPPPRPPRPRHAQLRLLPEPEALTDRRGAHART